MRQYIGARYVPIIFQNPDDNTNNWKSNTAYEPLTIVSYSNASYTSKKDVPASVGNPADNPDYWVAIGLYSGQTSANTTAIRKIKESIINNIEDGTTASHDYSQGDLLWVNGYLCEATENITAGDTLTVDSNIILRTVFPITRTDLSGVFPITRTDLSGVFPLQPDDSPIDYAMKSFFRNKRIMIVGDSISDESVYVPNWVAKLRDYLDGYNCTIINKSVSGSQLCGANGMANAIASYTETDLDIIIFELGTNDCNTQVPIGKIGSSSVYELMGALNTVVNKTTQTWYNAQIFYIIPPKCSVTPPDIYVQYLPRSVYRYAIKQLCNIANWNIIDAGCGLPQFNPAIPAIKNRYSDGIHPLPAYANYMMKYIVSQIISGGTTSIGTTSTTINLATLNKLNTTDFESTSGSIQFTSDGMLRLKVEGTVKSTATTGLLEIVQGLPSQLHQFLPLKKWTYGCKVNDITHEFYTLGDKVSLYASPNDTVGIDIIINEGFLEMLEQSDISI